jgi:site-specific DNA-methyltransferase (cytosine-N4-specific)
MNQLDLIEIPTATDKWKVDNFSANGFGEQSARLNLEQRYIDITEISDDFNRQSVSHQLSKKDCLHRWLKYKEGFSADLVNRLLKEFALPSNSTVLDPFLGSGTTSLVCQMNGINSIGMDILPMTGIAISAKQAVFQYDVTELKRLLDRIKFLSVPAEYAKRAGYLAITEGAYPSHTEKEIAFFTEWNQRSDYSALAKNLVTLCILNSLEKISYTAKDGQYLRWDYRSKKIIQSAEDRRIKGKKPLVVRLDKGRLPPLKEILLEELRSVTADIDAIQQNTTRPSPSAHTFIEGSALFELPKLSGQILDGVITSPPYCNRYDYTRIYALELGYLNVTEEHLRQLRQELLSCTVENKSKLARLREHYHSLNRDADYNKILEIFNANEALNELRHTLNNRLASGDINNRGVLRMVDGYFSELAFVFSELYRLSKPGAKVAFVNDNVRYAGEVIPVDFISTELAEQIGFIPRKIFSLKQQKGNSSQQMKKFGRVPLRKSITIWEKP